MRHQPTFKLLLCDIKQQVKRLLSNGASSKLQPFSAIPGPKSLPVLGNLWRYLPIIGDYKPDTLFENSIFNREHYGTIVREQLTKNHTILHLFDPNDIESFFRQDEKYPHRRSHRALLKYRRDRPELYLDGGLFPENGPGWYRQRRQFQHYLLSRSSLESSTRKLDEISLTTVERIKSFLSLNNSTIIDNFEFILYRWALENSLSLFLDCKIDQLDTTLTEEIVQQLHNSLIATEKTEIQSEKWIKHPDRCPHYAMLAKSQEFLYDFVSKQIDCLEKTSTGTSFIRSWLFIDKLDRRDVVSFVIDSLMAGLHTTFYTISWLLYYISKHDDLNKSLRAEINCEIPSHSHLSMNHVDKLKLLKDCLKETMRLNPVAIGTGRVTQDNISIRNYEIPKGSMIIAQIQAIGRDESIYSDNNEFKPERWASYRACPRHQRPSPFAFLPFGYGARACIGQRLVELQIKILTVRLLQHYDIRLDEFKTKTVMIHTIDGHIKARIRQIL